MKRKETIAIENALIKETRKKRIYGCEEVTIGFYNQGKGNEIVDFMTMDSKGVIKCYELKISLQDLKSNAKKSWYGHYNYLVTTKELYDSISDWDNYIPKDIGILIAYAPYYSSLQNVRKAKRKSIDSETELMLKESLVRSMFWKMEKYKDAQSLEKQRNLNSKLREANRQCEIYRERALKAESIINTYETYKSYNDGEDINLQKLAKEEKEKFRNRTKERT